MLWVKLLGRRDVYLSRRHSQQIIDQRCVRVDSVQQCLVDRLANMTYLAFVAFYVRCLRLGC